MAKEIFTIDLNFTDEPRSMSARLSHTGRLELDNLQHVADLLDDLIKVGTDFVTGSRTPTKPKADRTTPGTASPAIDAPGKAPFDEPAPVPAAEKEARK